MQCRQKVQSSRLPNFEASASCVPERLLRCKARAFSANLSLIYQTSNRRETQFGKTMTRAECASPPGMETGDWRGPRASHSPSVSLPTRFVLLAGLRSSVARLRRTDVLFVCRLRRRALLCPVKQLLRK